MHHRVVSCNTVIFLLIIIIHLRTVEHISWLKQEDWPDQNRAAEKNDESQRELDVVMEPNDRALLDGTE